MSEQSTALTVIERAQVALQPAANDKHLAELAAASKSIVTITNPDGYQQCHAARMALKNQRVAIEKIAKTAREDATAFSKAVIAEEKRLIGIIAPEEQRLQTIQDEWDAARAAEKKAREDAERARVQAHQTRLAKLAALPEVYTASLPPDRLLSVIQQLEAPPAADYEEFAEQATALRQAALIALRAAHVEACERVEREEAARAAEAARLAAEAEARAAEEERQRQERIAEEARLRQEREAEEARRQAENERLEAERQERDRIAAEARAAEEARLAEVRRQLAAEQAEQRRVAEIRQWIVALNGPTHLTATDSPVLIEQEIRKLEDSRIDARYAEFASEAAAARAHGIARLTELCNAAQAHKAEQTRLAEEQAALKRQQEEQAARQAEIERREREAREAEEARAAAARAEEERREAEAARKREAEERRAETLKSIARLTAEDVVRWIASECGCEWAPVAARIAEIPHEDWVALAVGEQEAAA